jgi:hypothetical protein
MSPVEKRVAIRLVSLRGPAFRKLDPAVPGAAAEAVSKATRRDRVPRILEVETVDREPYSSGAAADLLGNRNIHGRPGPGV